MTRKLKNKIIAGVLISLIVTIVGPASFAQAQLSGFSAVPVTGSELQNISRGINGSVGGIGGISVGTGLIGTIRRSLSATCQATLKQVDSSASTFLNTFNNNTFGLIDGSGLEAAFLKVQTNTLKAAYDCIDLYVVRLTDSPTTNLQDATEVAREQQTFSSVRDTLGKRLDDLNARASASWKEVLRGIMVRTILNLNKNLTTQMVNKMVDKYKISNYAAYGDALTSQIYSMKYINENYAGDAQTQMMLRSILQSEKLPEKIKTAQAAASSQAQTYLGSACKVNGSVASSDLSSYVSCLAAYGAPQADPTFHMFQAADKARSVQQAGRASTNAEIAQSNGFAPPRNCAGSLDAQKQIDAQFDKVANEKNIAIATRDRLALALKQGKTTAADYAQAVKAADQAIANYNQVNKQANNPIIDICEGITSPSNFVSTTINNFLKQHFDQTSNLKSDNLPFYATFLSDMAGNFLTNILTGGKSNAQVFKEAGAAGLNAALGGLKDALPQQGGTGSTGGTGGTGGTPPAPTTPINIFATASGSNTQTTQLTPGQAYTITIDFTSVGMQNPTYIEISGAGQSIRRDLTAAEKSSYRVQFSYTATNSPVTLVVELRKPFDSVSTLLIDRYTKEFTVAGGVAGASIILPRGPATTFR